MTLIAFFTLVNNIHALDNLHFKIGSNEYAAGIEGRFLLSHSKMREMVFADTSGDSLISEIEWETGWQAAAGTGFYLGPADQFRKTGFSLEGLFLWYFPANNKTMKDSDWDYAGKELAYGESNASVMAGMEAEGRFAAHFPLHGKYLIEASAEVWYGRHAAAAHDGWTSWAGEAEKIPLYGRSVEYIQEWIVLAPGLGIRRKLKNAHFGIRAAVSPFLWGYHIDNHYFRKLEHDDTDQKYVSYTDNTKGGLYYRIRVDWQWNITRYVQMGIAAHYRALERSRGDTTIRTSGLVSYSFLEKETAGAAIRNFSVDISIRTLL